MPAARDSFALADWLFPGRIRQKTWGEILDSFFGVKRNRGRAIPCFRMNTVALSLDASTCYRKFRKPW
jgi:hypothetical protein